MPICAARRGTAYDLCRKRELRRLYADWTAAKVEAKVPTKATLQPNTSTGTYSYVSVFVLTRATCTTYLLDYTSKRTYALRIVGRYLLYLFEFYEAKKL